jgi:sterol desaturase/sphingolipid hydroxylase (fatty acid hydroxylase superfamily)
VGLVFWIVLAVLAERRWPAHPLDRRRFLKLDLLGLGVLLVGVNLARPTILALLTRANVKGLLAPVAFLGTWPMALKIVGAFLVNDFCLYWIHRAMHGPLWPTHRWHHSIRELWWFAGSSIAHAFLFATPQMFVAFFLFAMSPIEAGVAFAIGVVFQIYIHSNTRIGLGPLSWLRVTPEYHRVHHGMERLQQNKNLSNGFTIWDRSSVPTSTRSRCRRATRSASTKRLPRRAWSSASERRGSAAAG